MTSYLLLPFAFVFHAALLTCEKPAPNVAGNKPIDSTGIIIEEQSIPKGEFYDDMPNAFDGELIMVPEDFVPIDADTQPQFPGGQIALQKYMDKYLEIPRAVRRLKVTGKVYTSFIISETGEIEEASIVKSLQYNCDQAALTLINNMPKWKPAVKDGIPVSIRHYLEIPFDYRSH
ncbi:energy transducer TonB [Dyadobacter fermentans]|uniref:energy transducer TonB n=1 Tax=Dyadobacter fermentans TaxID=94254 RepID=UPI001CBD2498|nr:energy transducer TonB [Dyadobacter fermentans]MBZ1361158.1 energy transducer TonB [Dyadobacter fermentans]